MAKSDKWMTKKKLEQIYEWAAEGLTDAQIACNMKISSSTFYSWLKKFPEFSESLKKGKDISDSQVENALFKNATGHTYTEEVAATKKTVTYSEDGKRLKEVTEPVALKLERHKPAETTAQIFYLKNRMPGRWKNQGGALAAGNEAPADAKPSKVVELQDYAKRKAAGVGKN